MNHDYQYPINLIFYKNKSLNKLYEMNALDRDDYFSKVAFGVPYIIVVHC